MSQHTDDAWRVDRDIECPLSWQLQKFLLAEGLCAPGEELNKARRFMRRYWLVSADPQNMGLRKERAKWQTYRQRKRP